MTPKKIDRVLEEAKIKLMRHLPLADLTYHNESDIRASFEDWISNFMDQRGAREAVGHLGRANSSIDEDNLISVVVDAIYQCYWIACTRPWISRKTVSLAVAKSQADKHAKALSAILEDVNLSPLGRYHLEEHDLEGRSVVSRIFEVSASEFQFLTKLRDKFAIVAEMDISPGRPDGAVEYGELAVDLTRLFRATIGKEVYNATAALINVTYSNRKSPVTSDTLKSLMSRRSAKG